MTEISLILNLSYKLKRSKVQYYFTDSSAFKSVIVPSETAKSPEPKIPALINNNFIKNGSEANQSIYDIFRRSKHKLYELNQKDRQMKSTDEIEKLSPSRPIVIDKKSLFNSFKRKQNILKNESMLPAVVKQKLN